MTLILFRKFKEITKSDSGVQFAQAVGMPYDRLFNFQELVKKMAKESERAQLPNFSQTAELQEKYLKVEDIKNFIALNLF